MALSEALAKVDRSSAQVWRKSSYVWPILGHGLVQLLRPILAMSHSPNLAQTSTWAKFGANFIIFTWDIILNTKNDDYQ